MNLELVEELPAAREYNRLRAAVGWGTQPLPIVERALPHSLYGVCAYLDRALAGMARVIGDGGLVYYIQDVIVLPEQQGKGIGAALMDAVMGYIRAHASHNSVVGLMSAKGKEGFYVRYGFIARPNDRLGCGMTIFWKVDEPGRAGQGRAEAGLSRPG
jgi:GNAT superfamily N-acetyltransferase